MGQHCRCVFEPLGHSIVADIHQFEDIYVCRKCSRFHVCDGGYECCLLDTRENFVCILTGKCVPDPVLKHVFSVEGENKNKEHNARSSLKNTFNSIVGNLYYYFSEVLQIDQVSSAIFDGEKNFLPKILDLLFLTFPCCHHLFQDNSAGDTTVRLVTSMYIHLIISMYANQTVYGSRLFKSTKNKKHDTVLKRMREVWMSMQATR